jgi:hypothetical protein
MSSPVQPNIPTVPSSGSWLSNPRIASFTSVAPLPVFIVVTIVLIVSVALFIFMRYKKGSLESTELLKSSIVLAHSETSEHNISPAGGLPLKSNGNEFSISFWVFIEEMSLTNTHKIVLYRGNSKSYNNGYFFVYLDAKNNRMYGSFRTNGVIDDAPGAQETSLESIQGHKYFLQSVIDYVPLERWVHIAYTIKETVLSTYLDGELYSVTSVYELPVKPDGSRPIPMRPAGDIMISGKNGKIGFTGYIGSPRYFNFALTAPEAKVVYNRGPYKKTLLSYIGMGNMGFRTPIYKITSEDIK